MASITVNEKAHTAGQWELIASGKTMRDLSNYDYRFSNNGGSYSFGTLSYYFGAVVNGHLVIRELEIATTSAEFEYDEINGRFQTGLNHFTCINAPECPGILTQGRSVENENFVLEDFSKEISVEAFLAASCTEIPHRDDEIQEPRVTPLWTAEQIDEYKRIFVEAGWEPKRTRGGDRRQRNSEM